MKIKTTIHDVAAYVLEVQGTLTTMKLQKLVYYCQAWSVVWDEKPIFNQRIEAWANGPISPDLWEEHKGKFDVKSWPKGSPDKLDDTQKETVDAVLTYYASRNAQWLSDLTHLEAPWKDARKGLKAAERGHKEITPASMLEYYFSIPEGA